jgi:hypothetical protein
MSLVHQWLEASLAATREVAATALDVPELGEGAPMDGADLRDWTGAFVSLAGDGNSLLVGISTPAASRNALAGMLLGMTPEESAELEEEDLADALGELINLIGGLAKTHMTGPQQSLQLGLPFVAPSGLRTPHGVERSRVELRLGDLEASLSVMRQPSTEKDS